MQPSKILVVDDDGDIRAQITRWLKSENYETVEAESGEQALEKVKHQTYSVVLLDLKLPEMDGFKVLHQIRKEYPDTCVIILTAFAETENIKQALREGAFDFFEKPIKFNFLLPRIESAIEKFNATREQYYQSEEEQEKFALNKIIGSSPNMLELKENIIKVAKTEATILILGESGTGKELVAKAIHYNSIRKDKPLMIADCSTITPSLIESELFGHEKGAFTGAYKRKKGKFERANSGTLFIDEIGELDKPLQMKLLRFLQEGTIERVGGEEVIPVDARVLTATAVDLKQAMERKEFREDLYFRLSVVTIHIPPLRERKEDIPLLVDNLIKIYNRKNFKEVKGISGRGLQLLNGYDFPGNVRELENIIHRAVIQANDSEISPEDITFDQLISRRPFDEQYYNLSIKDFVAKREKEYIIYQLNKHDWHISKTSEIIGIDRSNLTLKMKKYGIKNHR
jgi:two-component system response regulator AtoC